MGTLVVGGCSWTDANYNSLSDKNLDCSWPKWPDLIEGNWDKVINTANSGAGNDVIIYRVKDEILLNSDVTTVIIAFSGWYRYFFPNGYQHNPLLVHGYNRTEHDKRKLKKHLEKFPDWSKIYDKSKWYEDNFPLDQKLIRRRIETVMTELYSLIQICLYKNIHFIGFQMIDFSARGYMKEDIFIQKVFQNNKYFLPIDKLNADGDIDMLNWPFMDLMINSIDFDLPLANKGSKAYRISADDTHPNDLGQKYIADWITHQVDFK